ncbi:MAG TPA: hypothetical protein V6C57_01175, partial [Coleofasciculaceae cyanobacterium]
RIPDTRVGRTSQVNEVEFGFDEYEGTTKDYGLEDPIPNRDVENAPQGYDPIDHATMMLTNLVLLDRERRVAATTFNPANHAQTITLSGSSQFTDPASDPVGVINNGLKSMIRRGNIIVMGEDTYTTISMHPKIVSAYHGTDGSSGVVPTDFLATLFRVDAVYVGAAWADYTRRGQTPVRTRLWNNHIALLRRDKLANLQSGATWGMTAQFGNRRTYRRDDPEIGLDGGQRVRVGESVEEIVSAAEFGSLIINATP